MCDNLLQCDTRVDFMADFFGTDHLEQVTRDEANLFLNLHLESIECFRKKHMSNEAPSPLLDPLGTYYTKFFGYLLNQSISSCKISGLSVLMLESIESSRRFYIY